MAISYVAHVGSFFGVYHQVVEEVVPLPEHLLAPVISAEEQADDPPGGLTPVLKNQIVVGARDEFFDSDLS